MVVARGKRWRVDISGDEEFTEPGRVKEAFHLCAQRPMTSVPDHLQQAEPLVAADSSHLVTSACTGNSKGYCGTPNPPKPMR